MREPLFLMCLALSLSLAAAAAPHAARDNRVGQAQAKGAPLTEANDSVNTTERTVTKLAEGVYTIRHPEASDDFPQGNTTVVIGDNEVLVMDSCYLPSAAKQDIEQIRQWTNKPVRYLVNSHWHYDHTMGNGTYAAAFPGLDIIAHKETRRQILTYNPSWFARYAALVESAKKKLESGLEDGKPLTDAQKAELKETLAKREPVAAEYKQIVDRAPNIAFDSELDVDLGNREVRIMHVGRGNTLGDAIVVLPKEKILLAGDMLDHPVPYLGGGFPSEEIQSLKAISNMDWDVLVPGHGAVLHGRAYLAQVIDFMQTVVDAVDKVIPQMSPRAKRSDDVEKAVRATIDVAGWMKKFAGDDKDNREFFDGFCLSGLIEAAYEDSWRK